MQFLIQLQWAQNETPWRLHISGFKDDHGLGQSDVGDLDHAQMRDLEETLSDIGYHTAAAGMALMRAEHEAYLQSTVDKSIDALTKARSALREAVMPTRDEMASHAAIQELPRALSTLIGELRETNDHLASIAEQIGEIRTTLEAQASADNLTDEVTRIVDVVRVHG